MFQDPPEKSELTIAKLCCISHEFALINRVLLFFAARQCSSRGGELTIHVRKDNRVDVAGQAVLVLQGSLQL